MCLSFRSFRFSICRCRSNRNNYWCVFSVRFGTICIYTNYRYSSCLAREGLFWNEGHRAIFCNSVFSFTWYNFFSFTVLKCGWNVIIHRNCFFFSVDHYSSTLELWLTCLCCALDIFCDCINTCWSRWFHFWCVSRFRRCSVQVLTKNFNPLSNTCECLFWSEGYRTIWCYCICSFTWHCYRVNQFSCLRIHQLSWNHFIDWDCFFCAIHSRRSTLKFRLTCLFRTLNSL